MNDLHSIIVEKIKESPDHSISFAEYMGLCLYHSKYGYYQQAKQKIGKQGDFYTSSSVHPVFAETFVDVAVRYYHVQDSKQDSLRYLFIEMGAGNGSFAQQFMTYLRDNYPDILQRFTYVVIEKSAYHIQLQRENLASFKEVVWVDDISELKSKGMMDEACLSVFFSNELLDAFPVYLIQGDDEELHEVRVSLEAGELTEVVVPVISDEIKYYLTRQPEEISLSQGQRRELPLDMLKWTAEVDHVLSRALWLTVDYGIIADDEWQHPAYREGTLRCFYQHQVDDNPYDRPGEKDITYHIPFPMLQHALQDLGWTELFLLRQDRFLLETGIMNKLSEQQFTQSDPFSDPTAKRNRAIRHLLSPEGISGSMYVLAVYRDDFGNKQDLSSHLLPFSLDQMINTSQNTR